MPKLITNISHTLPDLKMELVEPTDISFEQLLLNYQMDMAFRRDPAENPALQSTCLYSEPFALAAPLDHPAIFLFFQRIAQCAFHPSSL